MRASYRELKVSEHKPTSTAVEPIKPPPPRRHLETLKQDSLSLDYKVNCRALFSLALS